MNGVVFNWEYSSHPNASEVELACNEIVTRAKTNRQEIERILLNTRPSHGEMFCMVVPPGYEYFAGNYRGHSMPGLVQYGVRIPGNGKWYYGDEPSKVDVAMTVFHDQLKKSLGLFKERSIQLQWDRQKKIAAFAKLVGALFVRFLAIHPYANGNGHISRLIVWCLFSAVAINSTFWSVPSRNLEPPDNQVAQFRDGYQEPLIQSFVKLIAEANP